VLSKIAEQLQEVRVTIDKPNKTLLYNSSMIGYYLLAFKLFVVQEIIEQVNVHLVSRTPEQD
jgi:hypothetical protein